MERVPTNTCTELTKSYDGSGTVFNIQRFSLHDGPGIRTLVFFKGCPLRCEWCSNPEGIELQDKVLLQKRKCTGCRACLSCPQGAVYEQDGCFLTNQALCHGCGHCVRLCHFGARSMSNKHMTAQEVVDVCARDAAFYKGGGGGLTLGGGDPMLQYHFAADILTLAKARGLSTAIETSAFASQEVFLKLAALCDTVHIDIKALDTELHGCITGVSNLPILRNIRALDAQGLQDGQTLVFRIPLIPGFNATSENVMLTGEFIASLKRKYRVEILPFHNFGESKYEQLCLRYSLADQNNMKPEEAQPFVEILHKLGLNVSLVTH